MFGDGPEAMESARTWAACTKNPGHTAFIPYPEFRYDHLPARWRTPERLETIRIIAEVTVRLRVGFTSWDRPEGFAFHKLRGTHVVHTGSGWVYDTCTHQNLPCPCRECVDSPTPQSTWMEIVIATACHVIYNSEEAMETQVDFFYDDEKSRRNGKMRTIWASDVRVTNAVEDTCLLRCVTHDDRLLKRLFEFRAAVAETMVGHRVMDHWRPTVDNVCVIISHPHGKPKHVTVGQVKALEEDGGSAGKLTYSANTCPGSSGALVLPVDSQGSKRMSRSMVHSLGNVYQDCNQSSAIFQHYRPRFDNLFCLEAEESK